jgi:multidrug efflux pump subunit AcrA (membrane-fusion protein)
MKRILAVLALTLAACGDRATPGTTSGGSGRGGGRGSQEGRVVPVEVAVAELGRVTRTTTLASTIEAARVVNVNAQIAGPLGSVPVREGARVARGTLLATIQVPELQAQLRSAESALEFAASTARRSEELFRAQIVTASEVERDRTALAAAPSGWSRRATSCRPTSGSSRSRMSPRS